MISVIVGTIVGEQIGGRMSDLWMSMRRRKLNGRSPEPEYRLWLSYFGFVLCVIGVVVFLVQLYNAGHTWNVSPLIGVGIAAAGNQVVTTVLVTYAVDCYRQDASSVGVFITFVRQIWGFIGPFWYVVFSVSFSCHNVNESQKGSPRVSRRSGTEKQQALQLPVSTSHFTCYLG